MQDELRFSLMQIPPLNLFIHEWNLEVLGEVI